MKSITRFGTILGLVALFALALTTFIGRSQLPADASESEFEFAGTHLPDVEVERQDGSNVSISEMVSDGVDLVFLVSVNDCVVWGGPASLDSPRAKLRWIPVVSRALGDLG